ncbi:MAG: hypothetical protein JO097_14165 [Acidobacteriaceae bacterium]|nr:hypothetical protein [Acidobacteriaceae bacterium]
MKSWLSDEVLLGIAAVCILALTTAATVRRPHVNIELTAAAKSIALTPAERLDASTSVIVKSPDDLLKASEFTNLSLGGNCGVQASRGLRIGGPVTLTALRMARNGLLQVEALENQLTIVFNGDGSADLDAGESARLTGLDGSPVSCGTPGSAAEVRLSVSGTAVPANLTIPISTTVNVEILPTTRVSGIGFSLSDESNASVPSFRSAILSGSIQLLDTHEKFSLESGEPLTLNGVSAVLSPVTLKGEELHVLLQGRVKSVKIGPSGFERDLTPTWLTWALAKYKAEGVWALAMGAMAALWKLRTWARKPQKSRIGATR